MSPVLSAANSRRFHQWCAQELIRLALNRLRDSLTHAPMPKPLGQLAYEAYCESRSWSSVKGEHLPPWHDQSADLKAAWDAAALAVELHLSQLISLSPSGTTSTASAHSGTP